MENESVAVFLKETNLLVRQGYSVGMHPAPKLPFQLPGITVKDSDVSFIAFIIS